jgi:hypothetical protein
MAQKRRGRPPGNRKEREPVIATRIPKDLLGSLARLAKKHGRTVSGENRKAIERWVERHEISAIHTSAFAVAIAVLADRVEGLTDKKWIDDPLTRQVVREHVQELVSHVLSPLSETVATPADVKEEAGLILALLKHAMPRPGYLAPRFWDRGTVIIDDRGLAAIVQDLARDLGEGRVNIETRPELVAGRAEDEKAWADAVRIGTEAAFMNYLQKFPYGRHVAKAREHPELVAWREQELRAWAGAESAGTTAALTNYLRKFASLQPKHAAKARKRLVVLTEQKGRK